MHDITMIIHGNYCTLSGGMRHFFIAQSISLFSLLGTVCVHWRDGKVSYMVVLYH